MNNPSPRSLGNLGSKFRCLRQLGVLLLLFLIAPQPRAQACWWDWVVEVFNDIVEGIGGFFDWLGDVLTSGTPGDPESITDADGWGEYLDDYTFWDYYYEWEDEVETCGVNPFTPHDGNVRRRVDDLRFSYSGLQWSRYHNSIRRNSPHRIFGGGGSWRHSWQFDLNRRTDSAGRDEYQFIYPSGRGAVFYREGDALVALPGGAERARLVAGGAEVDLPGGRRISFVTGVHPVTGRPCYYAASADSGKGEAITLDYDGRGRLVEVRDGNGNWLKPRYREYEFGANRFPWVARAQAAPAAGQWLEVVIPAERRLAAKSARLLLPAGAAIAEVQVLAEGSARPLAGTPLAAAEAHAFDGYPATILPAARASRFVGLALAAPARVERVRVLAAPGHEAQLAGLDLVLEAVEPALRTDSVVDRVETSDGRVVRYAYETSRQALFEEVALVAAHYGDGASATYRYSAKEDGVANFPLLVEADDPRYAGPAKHIAYAYHRPEGGRVTQGVIKAEINPLTGQAWARLEFDPADPLERTVVYSDDRAHTYRLMADGSNRTAEETDALGRTKRHEYAPGLAGPRLATTDHAGRRTEWSRDEHGREKSMRDSRRRETSYQADEKGRLRESQDSRGRRLVVERDARGKIARLQKDGRRVDITRDARGRATRLDGLGSSVAFEHDAQGRLAAITDRRGATLRYTRDQFGKIATATDALGRITRYERNERGLITALTTPDGQRRTFSYDKYGRKIAETDAAGRTSRSEYDILGRVIRQEDFTGRVTIREYSEFPGGCASCTLSRRPTRIVSPDGTAAEMLYDAEGRLLASTVAADTPQEATTVYTYDSDNNPVSITDPLGRVTRHTHDDEGRRLTATDPLGRVTRWTYDEHDRVTSVTAPDGGITRHTYDERDRLTSITDAAGHVTRYAYDDLDNLSSVTDAAGKITRHEYDGRRRTATIYPDGNRQTWEFDAAGRAVRTTSPEGVVTARSYDAGDRVLESQTHVPGKPAQTNRFAYDALGRRSASTDPLGRIIRWSHDANGNVLSTTRPDGLQTGSTYDAQGRRTSSTDAAGNVTRYEYDSADNLVALTDARSSTYRFTYDARHRKTAMIYPDGSQEIWAYDLAGQLAGYVNRAGQTKTIAYNAGNLPISETWSAAPAANLPATHYPLLAPAVTYTYDAAGRLTALDNGQAKLTYTYDALGRVASETSDFATLVSGLAPHTVRYAFDRLGRKSGLTYPDGTGVTYDYDARGRLESVSDGPGRAVGRYDYDPLGRIEKLMRDNNVATSYVYDMAGQLTDIAHTKGNAVLAGSHYALDPLGRRVAQTREDNITESYAYDATSQLTGVDYGNGHAESFTYDPAGNRVVASEITNLQSQIQETAYTTNALNQYTQVGGVMFAYDANGNLIDDGEKLYRYDAQNRLISVESLLVGGAAPVRHSSQSDGGRPDSVRAEFFYDARNRCVLRKYYTLGSQGQWILNTADSRALTYDTPWNLLAERTLDGVQVGKYIHGLRTDEILRADLVSAVHPLADGLGSTIALADRQGRVIERYRYSVYGTPQNQSDGDLSDLSDRGYCFLFTGRQWLDAGNLNDHRNRHYMPRIGRWLSKDPIRLRDGPNVYRALANSPVNYLDSHGLYIELWYGNHPVVAGNHHSKLWVITDEAAFVSNSSRTFNTAIDKTTPGSPGCGIWFIAIGAGPVGLSQDELGFEFNRPNDKGENLNNASLVTTFGTDSAANSFLNVLEIRSLTMNSNFLNTTLEYEAFPGASYIAWDEWDEFNSNSYVSGILNTFSYTPPPSSGANTPGYDKPVPSFVFTMSFANTAALRTEWALHYPGFTP